jgi:LPXTG-motif cell wall-anchored protein
VELESVRTSIEIQVPPGGRTATTSVNSSQRLLQAAEETDQRQDALLVVFDVYIDFRSVSRDQNVASWVFSAFDASLDRAEYVMDLQQRSATFNPVEDVETTVEGYVPPPAQLPDSGSSKANVAVIVGAIVGGLALIILVALLVMRRRNGKKAVVASEYERQSQTSPSTNTQNVKVSTEILVEPQDDVSTLGDPMFGAGGMMMSNMEKDEVTARYAFLSCSLAFICKVHADI